MKHARSYGSALTQIYTETDPEKIPPLNVWSPRLRGDRYSVGHIGFLLAKSLRDAASEAVEHAGEGSNNLRLCLNMLLGTPDEVAWRLPPRVVLESSPDTLPTISPPEVYTDSRGSFSMVAQGKLGDPEVPEDASNFQTGERFLAEIHLLPTRALLAQQRVGCTIISFGGDLPKDPQSNQPELPEAVIYEFQKPTIQRGT